MFCFGANGRVKNLFACVALVSSQMAFAKKCPLQSLHTNTRSVECNCLLICCHAMYCKRTTFEHSTERYCEKCCGFGGFHSCGLLISSWKETDFPLHCLDSKPVCVRVCLAWRWSNATNGCFISASNPSIHTHLIYFLTFLCCTWFFSHPLFLSLSLPLSIPLSIFVYFVQFFCARI